MRKIVLIACASYFEGHKQIVKATSETLRALGGYSLDIITNYGSFLTEWDAYNLGESSIYELLQTADYDGAIVENNLGSVELMQKIGDLLKEKHIPFVSVNRSPLDCPQFCQDNDGLIKELIEHMIHVHGAKKINFVINDKRHVLGKVAYEIYKEVLAENNIPFEEERVFAEPTSLERGESVYDEFLARGKQDCDAVILYHDVNAIGLVNRMQAEGIRVPEDVKIATLHCSANSIIYRPNLSGIISDDTVNARNAALALDRILHGEPVASTHKESNKIFYGRSCGCGDCTASVGNDAVFQSLAVTKISNAGQMREIMRYTLTLKDVSTLDQLGKGIESMLDPIGCKEFSVCINKRDLPYLKGDTDDYLKISGNQYDDAMYLLATSEKGKDIRRGHVFSKGDIYPYPAKEGDVHIIMPIHYDGNVFGYVVHKNSFFPAEVYNYRICHDSIGRSLDTFRQQLVLKKTISELDRLRMMDYMTETYNREGIDHFRKTYFGKPTCVVVIADMDDLKQINDDYGHILGDTAIKITASVLRSIAPKQSVVIRYGGDEFMILSNYMDSAFWEKFNENVNAEIAAEVQKQELPFHMRASIGYTIYVASEVTPEEAIATADKNMYEDKRLHKQ